MTFSQTTIVTQEFSNFFLTTTVTLVKSKSMCKFYNIVIWVGIWAFSRGRQVLKGGKLFVKMDNSGLLNSHKGSVRPSRLAHCCLSESKLTYSDLLSSFSFKTSLFWFIVQFQLQNFLILIYCSQVLSSISTLQVIVPLKDMPTLPLIS